MQPAQTPLVDYRGTRHARLTKSMKALPSSPLKVLVELRYMLADGQTGIISNATLARRTGLSEGYISPCVRWLAGDSIGYMPQFQTPLSRPFIERQKADGPGYLITMLPPSDQRTVATPPPRPADCPVPPASEQLTLWGDHGHEPQHCEASSAAGSDTPHESGDHGHDPSIFYIHTDQQQQHACASDSIDQERPAEVATPELWREMCAGTPGYNRLRWEADKAKLLSRPGYTVGMIINAVRNGQPVWSREEMEHGTRRRSAGTPQLGSDTTPKHRRNTAGPDRRRRRAEPVDRRAAPAAPAERFSDRPYIDLAALGLPV